MVNPFQFASGKLTFFAALSIFLIIAFPYRTVAHEVQPTIADVTATVGGEIILDFRINLETFLAGIDLDVVADTDEDAAAPDYDALRALSAEEIALQVDQIVEQWNALPLTDADGAIALQISNLTIPENLDLELPRISELQLKGQVPQQADAIKVSWPAGAGALVIRQQGVEEPYTGYLEGGTASPDIALAGGGAQSPGAAFASYIPVGFDHILPKGLDHILFVLGLFFLSTRWGPLLWQISAFTLAHTVTLALGALGWVNIPGSVVEPMIAASIVYVAVENLFQHKLTRWRPFVIFGFGLLHGLGFASVLEEFGLPEDQFIPALVGFNVGVEIGQLTVIASAALMLWGCTKLAQYSELTEVEQPVGRYAVMFRAVSIPASLLIAIVGGYWCVERVFL